MDVMFRRLHGAPVFDGRTGECTTHPSYDEDRDVLEEVWASAVRAIDWSYVMLMAAGRHVALRLADSAHGSELFDGDVCGRCVAAALLVTENDRLLGWAHRPDRMEVVT